MINNPKLTKRQALKLVRILEDLDRKNRTSKYWHFNVGITNHAYDIILSDFNSLVLRSSDGGQGIRYTKRIRKLLESYYDKSPYPTKADKECIKNKTGLDMGKINRWFCNKRHLIKKKNNKKSNK